MALVRKLKKDQEVDTVYLIEKKRVSHEHSDANWIISYADMMTLLCIFFIMLFSMSKLNTPEFEAVKKQVAEHFGTKYEAPSEDLGKFINNVLVEAGVQKDATMTSDGVSVSVAFHSTLFFDTLSAEISPAGRDIIEKIAVKLNEYQEKKNKKFKIVIEGHTDSQPIVGGPFPSNWELSSSRATRVVRLFLEKKFDPAFLLAIGYSDTKPVAPSRNPDGTWNNENLAKNRRVVLRVLMPEVDSIPWNIDGAKSAQSTGSTTQQTDAPVRQPSAPVAEEIPAENPAKLTE